MYKKIQMICYLWGATLIQGSTFIAYLPNVPGAMFIQDATSIPDSRARTDRSLCLFSMQQFILPQK